MSERVLITVAICTYNRSSALEGSVGSSFAQETDVAFEVLVVDNNSTDDTREVVEKLTQRFPSLRYVVEKKQGLSHARNRALEEARGEIVAYIDDDCTVLPGWITNVAKAFEDPTVGCAGGRIAVGYPGDKPSWVTPEMEPLFGLYDYGDLPGQTDRVFGGNLLVRRDLARQLGGFSTRLGYQGKKHIGGEDVDFARRVAEAGYSVVYVPDAMAIHHVEPTRISQEWVLRRIRLNAATALMMSETCVDPGAAAADWVRNRMKELAFCLVGRTDAAFACRFRAEHYAGLLDEMLRGPFGALHRYLLILLAPLTWAVRKARRLIPSNRKPTGRSDL
jgi:GT2 family glycosyltransferase